MINERAILEKLVRMFRLDRQGKEAEMTSVPTTRPPEGFRHWIMDMYPPNFARPRDFALVEVWKEPWRRGADGEEREILAPNGLNPYFNVAGLYWRPVKAHDEIEN